MTKFCMALGLLALGCESTSADDGANSDAGAGGSDNAGGAAGGGGGGGGNGEVCRPLVPAAWTGPAPFAAPQAVVFAGDFLAVANTGVAWNPESMALEFGEGFVTVIDPLTGAIVNRIATRAPNPQKLVVHGDRLFIVNTGTTTYDAATSEVHVTGPGSIDFLPLVDLDTAAVPHGSTPFTFDPARPLLGAPVDLAFVGERAYITSGTSNSLFVFNAGNGVMERGPENPLQLGAAAGVGLGSIVAVGEVLYVTDFNSDLLWRVKGADDSVSACGVAIGQAADLEGATSPRLVGQTLFVMLAVAGSVEGRPLAALDAAFDNGCAALEPSVLIDPLGQYPNELGVTGDHLLVVNSGDNQVVEYSADGAEVTTFDLPPNANPWSVAVDADARRLAVSEQMGNGVTVFDRVCEGQSWRQGNPAP